MRFADLLAHRKMQENMEQCYTIEFCAKRKKIKQEAFEMLKEANGDEQMIKASFIGGSTNFLNEVKDELSISS